MHRLLAIAALTAFVPLTGCGVVGACFASTACTGIVGAGLGYAASVNNLGAQAIGVIVGKKPPAAPAQAAKP